MALINCPECNKEISDSVKICPGCGYKLKRKKVKKEPKFIKTKKQKKIFITILIVLIAALLATGGFFGYKYYLVPLSNYKAAIALVDEQKYDEAIEEFGKLEDFKNSKEKILETHYKKAESLLESDSFREAVSEFEAAGDYKDAKDRINDTKYLWAQKADIDLAINLYEELGDYKDSKSKLFTAKEKKASEEALEKIESAYNKCVSDGTTLASDKKSIMVDSSGEYDYLSLYDVNSIISSLGLPDSLYAEMCATNALMGRQSQSFDYYEVSWSYHPSNGLDVIFKYKG